MASQGARPDFVSRPSGFLLERITSRSSDGAAVDSSPPPNHSSASSQAETSRNSSRSSKQFAHGPSLQLEETKEAARLSSLVMNLRLASERSEDLKNKVPLRLATEALAQYHGDGSAGSPISPPSQFSEATQSRVKKVKAKMELKYQMIHNFQYHDLPEAESEHFPEKLGYNPLQTIRNRRIRLDLYRKSPYARFPKNHWQVDPAELLVDYGWSVQNKHLLRDRQGHSIYSDRHSADHRDAKDESSREQFVHRLRQRLRSSNSSQSSGSSDEHNHHRIHRFHDRSQSASVQSPSTPNHENPSRMSSPVRNVAITSRRRPLSVDNLSPQLSHEEGSPVGDVAGIPIIHMEGPDKVEKSIRENMDGAEDTNEPPEESPEPPQASKGELASTDENSPREISRGQTEESEELKNLEAFAHEVNHLDMVFFLSHMLMARKNLVSKELDKDRTAQRVSNEIATLSHNATTKKLPELKRGLKELELKAKNAHHDLSANVSPRMDNLLVESDRLLGEVSTTLNLEMRKIGERLDHLEAASASPVKLFWTIGYSILEWVLVMIMWVVWGLVSVLLAIRSLFRAVIWIIKWLLWC
uniref:ARAD1C03190p n=1 Tax=Blastobotrys adeninivorans TaxID=409370 RepID=A0A060SZT4_BLAAD